VLGVFANRLVLCHRHLRADKPVTDAEEMRWRVEQCLKDAEVSACLVWLGSEGLREHNHPHAVRMVHQFSRVDGSCLKDLLQSAHNGLISGGNLALCLTPEINDFGALI
jgi:hypothetical protein